ncbi:hypothetical protein PQX77_012000 [Marasmius sp. AFHP31]|nr:hypothetical protein PQX77_012000 [Marasmius sp. AFHP31]
MNQDDVLIAVMGATGSGKSSFIKLVTGDDTVRIGHTMESETTEVKGHQFFYKDSGRNVILFDTPGFDDSRTDALSDTEVLKRISKFLEAEYKAQRKLNGIIYIHRINENRFSGQHIRNLRMFKNLCGTQAYQNVVVLTTHWDIEEKENVKEGRERDLQTNFFKGLVEGGAKFMRHDPTRPNPYGVLGHIFPLMPTDMQIQRELCVEKKKLEDTLAGSVRREEVESIIAQHKAEVDSLRKEMDDLRADNEDTRREIEQDRQELINKLARLENERKALQEGLEEERRGRLRREEEEDELAAKARDRQKFMQKGLRMADKIPLFPNVLAKPLLGGVGIGFDQISSLSQGCRRK